MPALALPEGRRQTILILVDLASQLSAQVVAIVGDILAEPTRNKATVRIAESARTFIFVLHAAGLRVLPLSCLGWGRREIRGLALSLGLCLGRYLHLALRGRWPRGRRREGLTSVSVLLLLGACSWGWG